MTFVTGIGNNIHTQFICQFQILPAGRIVTCPHQVNIELLHDQQILEHCLCGDCLAVLRVVHMAVHTVKFNHGPVNIYCAISYLGLPETHLFCNNFLNPSITVPKCHDQGI